MRELSTLLISLFIACHAINAFSQTLPAFRGKISPIPANVEKLMRRYTWKPGCPVPLSRLRYLQLRYDGFDHKAHTGVLIVTAKLAKQVVTIFKRLYQHHFPIQSMLPAYRFKGNDETAMQANNTSGFDCRLLTGHKHEYSQHAYGRAIDINTRTNPYVKGHIIIPKNAKSFVNRKPDFPGKISHGDFVYKTFISRGWQWGGDWRSLKDYQHFEKRR